ncbi:hypothetical protein KAR91_69430, partial [Candidatus Pacearchaeota archaeon]|nr:hypothetical protein [Candidatus Pacearchaeota archaeon]
MRYRKINFFIPDFEDVEYLTKSKEKPPFDPWYCKPGSVGKLFDLFLFIGNDDPEGSTHEIGQSSRS